MPEAGRDEMKDLNKIDRLHRVDLLGMESTDTHYIRATNKETKSVMRHTKQAEWGNPGQADE
jgi:hypothetical protein